MGRHTPAASARAFVWPLLPLALSAIAAFSADIIVFGPQTYHRGNGRPVTVTKTFSVSNPSNPYTLRVVNRGVTNAVIALNGRRVLGPRDFTITGRDGRDGRDGREGTQNERERRERGDRDDRDEQDESGDPVPLIERSVSLRNGRNEIAVELRGKPGTSLTVEILRANAADTTPPTITATANPQANASGWNNATVTVTFTCADAESGVATCPDPIVVAAEGANQLVSGSATDNAGNTATASVTVNLDKSSPTIQIALPSNGAVPAASPVAVMGGIGDTLSGVASVTCNGAAATITNLIFNCTVPLLEGSNQIAASVTDAAGNVASATVGVSFFTSVPGPAVTVESPAPLAVFNGEQAPVTVSGTVDDPDATVVLTSPDAPNGVQAAVSGGTWRAQNVPLREGHNLLTATGKNARGGVGTATRTVTLDTTAPIVRIDSPPAGAVLTAPQVSVSGVVNDIVPGTVNSEQVRVQVNGLDAQVSNRSFVVPELLLARGRNTLTAVATDRAGNQSQTEIQITVQGDVSQQRIEMVSGNHQTGVIGTTLDGPLLVRLIDASGAPVANRAVTFRVVKSDGTIGAADPPVQELIATTDERGTASATLQLGTRSGVGNNQVAVSAPGFTGTVIFSESATVGPPVQINGVSGENQRGLVGQPLSLPFVVIVFDAGGNPVEGVPLTFKVLQGGGSLGGVTEPAINTNADGKADALLTLGENEGVNNNVVAVGFGGDPALVESSQRVTFQASGLVAGAVSQTRVSGVVLDNADVPIPNATATIVGTGLSAVSDPQGRFSIANAPVGTITLIVDGRTSTRPETFPFLAFVMNTIAGTDNTIGMPIYVPPLDVDSSKIVGGDEETVLTMAGVPGVAFTVAPHSTTLPDGRHEPVRMMLSQVHADKVPMPPPNGSAPRLVWTLQPAGVTFDPPIQVQVPNADGLAPGQVIEIYQFDHDLEQFVSTGPARVSPDGSVIVSDRGFGITKSGWGGSPPPPPPKNCSASCNDNSICTADRLVNPPCKCDNPPANEGAACGGQPGQFSCLIGAICVNGNCSLPSRLSDPFAPCDDGIFCTEPDKCGEGGFLCFGETIPDRDGPAFAVEAKFGEIKTGFEKYGGLLGVVKDVDFKIAAEGNQKLVCCEQKREKDVGVRKAQVGVTAALTTEKIFLPPPFAFDIKAVRVGVFVTLSLSASVSLNGENDLCADTGVCWKGGIQISGGAEGGLAAERPGIASVSGSCGSGLQMNANVSCKEYQIDLSTSPFKCKFSIELFNGFIAFGVEREVLGSVPLIQGPRPLPPLQ